MKFKFVKKNIEIVIIFVLGLTPLLWFRGSEVILGHDSGLPLDPVGHFLDRLSMWTYRFGIGNDQTYASPGFFFHGLEGTIHFFTNNLQLTQKITFIFWFVLPGITMFYLGKKLEKKLDFSFIALPSAVFYMFNHFLLQAWFVAERTKISLYAALPLLVVLLFDWMENKRSNIRTAVLISVIFFFLNGLASLPLFGSVIVVCLVFTIYYLIFNHTFISVLKLIILFLETLIISFFLQLYWLLPYSVYLKSSYEKSVEFFGGESGVLGWVKYVSENSSLSNIFRLQGIPEWYQNPLHPYASFFLNNPILIIVSTVLPILCFIPFLKIKDKKKRIYLLFFLFIALASIIFTAGAHPPFGFFYLLLVEKVPGFIAFRTPFYKFGSGLWFSYAVLIGITFGLFYKLLKKKKRLSVFYKIVIILLIVLYSFPFLNGSFFDYIKGVRSNRVTVPSYVYNFQKWSKDQGKDKRILVLPQPNTDLPVDAYTWGYWSLAPLSSLLTNTSLINKNSYLSASENALVGKLYEKLQKKDPSWIELARALDIDTLLLRNDFAWNLKDTPTVNPDKYKYLLTDSHILSSKKFGNWDLLFIKDTTHTDVKSYSSVTIFNGDPKILPDVFSLPSYNDKSVILATEQNEDVRKLLSTVAVSDEYTVGVCVMCDLEYKFINQDLFTPLVLKGSRFYPIVKLFLGKSYPVNNSSLSLSYQSLENLLALQKAMDMGANPNTIQIYIEGYSNSLNSLVPIVKNEYINTKLYDIDNTIELISNWHLQSLIIKQIEDKYFLNQPLLYGENRVKFNSFSKTIDSLITKVDSVIWRTESVDEKRVVLRVNNSGNYTLFVNPENRLKKNNSDLSVSLDKELLNASTDNSNGWISYDNVALNAGENRISVTQPVVNLFNGPSLLEFTSGRSSCYSTSLISTERNEIFKISFDQSSDKSGKFFIKSISQNTSLTKDMVVETIISTNVIQNHKTEYAGDGKPFYLLICNIADPKNTQPIDLTISNLSINLVNTPEVIAYKKNSLKQDLVIIPKTNNASKNSIEVDDLTMSSPILALTQSFNTNWKISPDFEHVTLNGYENGWILRKNIKLVKIRYVLQDLFLIGAVVSVVSILLCALYLLRDKILRR